MSVVTEVDCWNTSWNHVFVNADDVLRCKVLFSPSVLILLLFCDFRGHHLLGPGVT